MCTRLTLLYSLPLLNHIRQSSFNGEVSRPPSAPKPSTPAQCGHSSLLARVDRVDEAIKADVAAGDLDGTGVAKAIKETAAAPT